MMSLTGGERTKWNEQSSGPKADKGKVFLPPTLSEPLFQRLLLPLTGLVDRGLLGQADCGAGCSCIGRDGTEMVNLFGKKTTI